MTRSPGRRVAPLIFVVVLLGSLLWSMRGLRDGSVSFVGSGTDVVSGMVPHLAFIQKQLLSARLPLWNPYIITGQPELGGAQWGVFYPFQLLVLPRVRVITYIKITLLFHLLVLGIGCYLLARWWLRRLGCERRELAAAVVGVTIPFSGFVMGHLYAGHVMMLQGLPYIALMTWGGLVALEGRRLGAVVCALSLSLVILAGGPQVLPAGLVVAATLWALALGLAPGQRLHGSLRLVAGMGAGILLAGVQLIPALELAAQSLRAHIDLSAGASAYTLSLADVGSLLVPGWAATTHGMAAWEFDAFVGAPLVALALLPLQRPALRWPTAVLLAVSAFAMAAAGPWASGWLGKLPGYSLLRVPSRLLLVPVLLTPLAAAVGLSMLCNGERAARRAALVAAFLAVGSGLLAQRVGTVAAYAACGWAALCALVWFIPVGSAAVRGVVGVLPGLAVLLLAAAGAFAGRSQDQIGQLPRPVSQLFAQAAPTQRVVTYLGQSWNRGMAEGFFNLGGYEPFASYRSALLFKTLDGADPAGPWRSMHVIWPTRAPRHGPLWDVFAVRFAAIEAEPGAEAGLRVLQRAGSMALVENPRALQRAYFHPCPTVVETPEQALAVVQRGWSPGDLPPTALEGGTALVCPSGPGSARVEIVADQPQETVVTVQSEVPGYLVLSDLAYPGWTARVDEQPVPIVPANAAGRAVAVTAGSHSVRFHFDPDSLRQGARVTLAGLATLLGLMFVRRLW